MKTLLVVWALLLTAAVAHAGAAQLHPACGLAGASFPCTTVHVHEEFFVVGCGLHSKLDSAEGHFTAPDAVPLYLFDVGADGCITDAGSPDFNTGATGTYVIDVMQRWGGKLHFVGSATVTVVP